MPTPTKVLYNKYDHPAKRKVKPGNPIYKYTYVDKKTGETKENTINMQEKIQSYLSQVDYKKRIELGLGLEAPLLDNGLHSDFTQLPDNTIDLVNLANVLGSLSQDQIANIIESSSKSVQTSGETGQTAGEITSASRTEVPGTDTNTQSANPTGGGQ